MYENDDVPPWSLDANTRVYDPANNRPVGTFKGHVTLPVGTEIELYDPDTNSHGTATVIKVRVLNGHGTVPPQICLDVEVESRWWDAHPEE